MSAICGLVNDTSGNHQLPELLRAMTGALPLHSDAGARYCVQCESVGLGVYQQFPLPGEDADRARSIYEDESLATVCTAEFYNARELAESLGGSLSQDSGEAALLGAAYRRFGLECFSRLEGPFAFALWDKNEKHLLLATDRFGIRPLHYYYDDTRFIFGSRIAALLTVTDLPRQIDLNAVYQYLYFSCIPTPGTIYRKIKKLPPGHYLLYSQMGIRLHRYWRMQYEEDHGRSVSYYSECLRELLSKGVREQATYNGHNVSRSIGCFLSGGTDSSTVTGLAGKALNQSARSFSIGFTEDYFNEIEYARIAARHFRTQHHEYFVTPEDTAALIPKLVQAYDEPFGNASAIPTFYCARLAQENGVDVLLAGDGGDELFGGNSRYADDRVFEVYQSVPGWFRKYCFEPLLLGLPLGERGLIGKARKYLRRSNLPQPRRYFSYNLLESVNLKELFTDDFLAAISSNSAILLAKDYYDNAVASTMLNRLLNIDLAITITDNDLRKVTRMCELANVGVRFPMLDRQLVEFSGKIPARLKVKGFEKRFIFKRAFKDFLPPEILAKKKHGFGLPISPWLRTVPKLRELACDTLLSQASLQRGYFKRSFLEKLFEMHHSDDTNFFGDNIWVFLVLELWHQSRQ